MTPATARHRVFTDGACRGNPGPASIGVVVFDPKGEEVATASETLGTTTNNVAEYTALERALDLLEEHGIGEADFFMDSQLIVRQLTGEYRVKDAKMRACYLRVIRALAGLKAWTVNHVPREENRRADALANQALDLADTP